MKIFLILTMSFLFINGNTLLAQNKEKEVSKYLQKLMEEQKIPALQVAVIKNNRIILSKTFGMANVSFMVPAVNSTIFSINSISKVFASTAIMQLVEKGKLETQNPVSYYLNGLPNDWQKVTIEQLLSHTSGLPDIEDPNSGELIGGKGMKTAWMAIQKMPLQFKAGDEFSYNATNYLLLEKIIEKLEGIDYEMFVKLNQFDVAKMDKTFYSNSSSEVTVNKSPTYCYYYFDKSVGDYILGDRLLEVNEEFPIKADAGIFSNAEEIAKWIIALQTEKLLNRKHINQMWKPVKLNNGKYGGFGGLLNAYAYGWPVINRKVHSGVSPFGGGRASFTIYPNDDLSIILFTNLSGLPTYEFVENISKFYLPTD